VEFFVAIPSNQVGNFHLFCLWPVYAPAPV